MSIHALLLQLTLQQHSLQMVTSNSQMSVQGIQQSPASMGGQGHHQCRWVQVTNTVITGHQATKWLSWPPQIP